MNKDLFFGATRSMFTSGLTESSQREVRIVGVESESMQLVLDYAYTSRVTLSESNVQALFTAASIFQIPALQDQCAQFMISRLDPQNCIGVFMFADAYGHQELKERSQDYIRKKVGVRSGPACLPPCFNALIWCCDRALPVAAAVPVCVLGAGVPPDDRGAARQHLEQRRPQR